MDWKKLGRALLFPPIAVLLVSLPVATVLPVYSVIALGAKELLTYFSYGLAAYTLAIWCVRISAIIRLIKTFKGENKYARRWLQDIQFRVNVSMYGALIWNAAYGIFQLVLGVCYDTFWFYSLGAYYICLAFMRFGLVKHIGRYKPGEKIHAELIKYRATGWVFLVLNLALSFMIFFMVYRNNIFLHHRITTIAMAAYTFTAFALAIINVIKYRKYNSPVLSASKAISLAAAFVSMLTLEATMLTTFNDGSMNLLTRRLFLGISGGAISVSIIAMAIFMILRSTKQIRQLRENSKREQLHGTQ